MLRSLLRSGFVAVLVLSLSAPAQALPLAGVRESEGFTFSLSTFWERLISPVVALWNGDSRAVCDPNGGGCLDEEGISDTRAICDPNGGGCGGA